MSIRYIFLDVYLFEIKDFNGFYYLLLALL